MTTTNYTETQAAAGFFGYFDLVNNSSRRSWTGIAVWAGYITGTAATLSCGSGDSNGPYWVSVDFAEETQPAISGGLITLFTGLSDTQHFVRIRADNGHTTVYNYTFVTGTFLSVTGAAPAMVGLGANGISQFLGNPSAPLQHTFTKDRLSTTINTAGTTPVFYWNKRTGLYNRQGAVRIRAKASEIWILCSDLIYTIYTDRTKSTIDLTSTDLVSSNNPGYANPPVWRRVLTGGDLSNFHTYQIIPKSQLNNSSVEGIMIVGSGCAYTTLTETDICYQYGDSITAAFNSGVVGEDTLDTYQYCAAMGILGAAKGHAGIGAQLLYEELSAATTGVLATNWQVSRLSTLAIGTNDRTSASSTVATTTSATGTAGSNVITLAGTSSGWAVGQFFTCPTGGGAANGGYIVSMGTSTGGNGTINLSANLVSNISGLAASGYPFKVSLLNVINLLLSYGHQKIAVRGCSTQYTGYEPREQEIINVVQTLGNPNVQYFGGSYPTAGTNYWTGISTLDGLHPDAAGYVTYAGYESGSTGYRTLFAAQVSTIDNETGALLDSQTYAPGATAVTVTESGTASDVQTLGATLQNTQTDSGSAVDSQSEVLNLVLAQTESGSSNSAQTIGATLQNSITETLAALDTQGTGTIYSLSQTDTGTSSDSSTLGATLQNAITETLSSLDSNSSVVIYVSAQTESGAALDASSLNATLQNSIGEVLNGVDTQVPGGTFALSQADLLSALDSQSTGSSINVTAVESGSLIEVITATATLSVLVTENGSLKDAIAASGNLILNLSMAESGVLTDLQLANPQVIVSQNDVANLTDSTTLYLIANVLIGMAKARNHKLDNVVVKVRPLP